MAYDLSDHNSQPFYVITDAAYDRMFHKLNNGSRFEWSFPGPCPHFGKCVCPKFMNVLKDGKIIRVANGKQKPVYKASDCQTMFPEGKVNVNIFMDRFESNPMYADTVKESARSFNFPAVVNIYMDSLTSTEKSFTITLPSETGFVDLIDSLRKII